MTVDPHPLAVITIASAPASTWGHQASISARMSFLPSSWRFRWNRTAPQHPAPTAWVSEMPSRSSTRAAAALIAGAIAGCTQPASTSILRAWRGEGHSPAAAPAGGTLSFNAAGSSGRTARPSASNPPKTAALGSTADSAARCSDCQPLRGTRSSTTLRPMSARRPYSTPEGQVVSHERQVRQRSRCNCVCPVTSAPSRACLIR